MKRDMDLVRSILLKVEESPPLSVTNDSFQGVEPQVIGEHLQLLEEAGYIEALLKRPANGVEPYGLGRVERLTWDGHEFLDTIRDKTVWAETQRTIGEKLASVSFALVTAVATEVAKRQLGF